MKLHSIRFDGAVLERGFWLYVVDIHSPQGRYLYVGRTGDSSSPNAGSPFSRIGQHLDKRLTAKGNALARQLATVNVDPNECGFEMLAVGPLYPEEHDFAQHKPIRDKVAALEYGLAQALRERGYSVIGQHSARSEPEQSVLSSVLEVVEARLRESDPIAAAEPES